MDFKQAMNNIQSEFQQFLRKSKDTKNLISTSEFETVPTGIEPLDFILGGGVALGSIMMITGRAGSGKSSLAGRILGSLIRHTNGKCIADYIDIENGITSERLEKLGAPGIVPKSAWTLEMFNKYIESLVAFKEENNMKDLPVMIVFDSLAASVTEKELKAEDPKEVIGFKARTISLIINKALKIFPEYNITLILINQLRDNLSVSMMPTASAVRGLKQGESLPGGKAVLFAVNQLVYLNDNGKIDDAFGFEGKTITAHCIKNRLFNPMIPVKLSFSYSAGYSNFWSIVLLLRETKYLVSAGGWWKLKYYDGKFRAKEMVELYVNNSNFRDAMTKCMEEYKQSIKEKLESDYYRANPDMFIEKSLKEPEEEIDINKQVEDETEISNTLVEPPIKPVTTPGKVEIKNDSKDNNLVI